MSEDTTENPIAPQAADGGYLLIQPLNGTAPDSITLTYNGTEYRFTDFQETVKYSRFTADVIKYGEYEVIE
jgi:hypothetical protein